MNNQNQASQTPPQAQPSIKPPLNKGLIIGLSVGIIVLLAVVVYLLTARRAVSPEVVNNNQANQYQRAKNQDQMEDTTPSKVEEWKTYKNEKFNYVLEIPKEWGSISDYDASYSAIIDNNTSSLILGTEKSHRAEFTISVLENNPNTKYTIDWYADFYLENRQYQKESLKIAGKDAVGLSASKFSDLHYTYLIEKGNRLYEIGFLKKDNTADKILSTFKFTN